MEAGRFFLSPLVKRMISERVDYPIIFQFSQEVSVMNRVEVSQSVVTAQCLGKNRTHNYLY